MRSLVHRSAVATAILLAVTVSSPTFAGILAVPPPSTTIDTFAEYDEEFGPDAVGPDAGSPDFFSDQARALGAAGAPGQLQSFSQAGGAGTVGKGAMDAYGLRCGRGQFTGIVVTWRGHF